jgi:hypothetical protein
VAQAGCGEKKVDIAKKWNFAHLQDTRDKKAQEESHKVAIRPFSGVGES